MKKRFLLDDHNEAFCAEWRYGWEPMHIDMPKHCYVSTKTARKIAAALLQLADVVEKEAKRLRKA